MNDDLLEWLDCPCSSKVCLPRTAKAHIEAQAAEIEYWKTEARNVRKELKSEQKQTDSAMDNYDAMQRRCEAQSAEIEKLRAVLTYIRETCEDDHITRKAHEALEETK